MPAAADGDGGRPRPRYAAVVQRQGLEISGRAAHLSWFGGGVAVPDYGTTTLHTWTNYLEHTLVPQIPQGGWPRQLQPPYGMAAPPELPLAQQNALLAAEARKLLPTETRPAALGADLLEVGYTMRQGVDLAHHVALWDVMSRNGVFLTANGRATTLRTELARDRKQLGHFELGRQHQEEDLSPPWWRTGLVRIPVPLQGQPGSDGGRLMPDGLGQRLEVNTRQLVAKATDIPTGGSLQVLQGDVDYPGTADLAANTRVVATYRVRDLAGGSVRHSIDTKRAQFRAHPGAKRRGKGGRPVQPGLAFPGRATTEHPHSPRRLIAAHSCVGSQRIESAIQVGDLLALAGTSSGVICVGPRLAAAQGHSSWRIFA